VKLGLSLGYAPPGTNPADLFPLVQEAERLGFDSVWVAEAWGTDAVSVLGWLA
jgi:alkanesulfonate monooxygenase SsuD/methylene tetrahydromethanopterin reductase-like flavin-dependent oxidoreductase (luciferase family)